MKMAFWKKRLPLAMETDVLSCFFTDMLVRPGYTCMFSTTSHCITVNRVAFFIAHVLDLLLDI